MIGSHPQLTSLKEFQKLTPLSMSVFCRGTLPASRLLNYAPEPVLAAVFIASTYAPPKGFMDLAKVNAWSKEHAGYERRGYFEFMTEERAADTIREHVSVLFATNRGPCD